MLSQDVEDFRGPAFIRAVIEGERYEFVGGIGSKHRLDAKRRRHIFAARSDPLGRLQMAREGATDSEA